MRGIARALRLQRVRCFTPHYKETILQLFYRCNLFYKCKASKTWVSVAMAYIRLTGVNVPTNLNDRNGIKCIDGFKSSRKTGAAVALGLVLAMNSGADVLERKGYELNVLSSRAEAVSGKDVLIELVEPNETSSTRIRLNGRDVTMAFRPTSSPLRRVGLIDGLQPGSNTLEVAVGAGVAAKLTILDHPLDGPIFSGPHQLPFRCETEQNGLGEPQDGNCSAKTIVTYYYKQAGGLSKPSTPVESFSAPFGRSYTAGFIPYDPSMPRPADIAQTTTSDGRVVDYVVREEIGTINRAVYDIQFLHQPGRALPTPWTGPTAGWNGRLVYFFGGGCQAGYGQKSLTDKPSFAGGFPVDLLSQGYAIATSTLNMFGNNCNDRISAETLSMVKEHFIKSFGSPVHTIGSGASGGSMQQHLIAQNYPGLLDGIVPALSFPDITSIATPVVDCSLLENAFKHAKESWSDDQKSAVAGFATWKTCSERWIGRDENFSPGWVSADNCHAAVAREKIYDREKNPSGVRCDIYDNEVNEYGRDATTHFARRPLDNIGVQYGLTAFKAGKISAEQFVELNETVGGFDVDGRIVTIRSSADREALRVAYEDGLINTGGGGLGSVPIIDVRPYMDDSGDFHDSFRSFSTRARLLAANGTAGNQIILMAARTDLSSALLDPKAPYRKIVVQAVLQMDRWLDAISLDTSSAPPSVKIVRNKPLDLVDACWSDAGEKIAEPKAFSSNGRCSQIYPIHADPRIAAGAPLRDDVLKCALKALSLDDYGRELSASQIRRLKSIFPQGVCNWSRPGVGQHVSRAAW
jgi:hypothetical protein